MALAAALGSPPAYADAPATQPASNSREATLAEYRQHLVELSAVVEACAKARNSKTCDPALAGQDDRVPLSNTPSAERRMVRYDWLRALLAKAREKDEPQKDQPQKNESQPKATENAPDQPPVQRKVPTRGELPPGAPPPEKMTRPPKPNTSQLLLAAEARLTQDIAQADGAAAAQPALAPDHAQERDVMKQVLSGRDFRNLEAPTARDSALEKLGAWLNGLFASFGKLQASIAWLGRCWFGALFWPSAWGWCGG